MRVYVDLTYTIAVDVDHAEYDAADDAELVEACRNDQDFAMERVHIGPHAVYGVDWQVADLYRHAKEALDNERPVSEVLVRGITAVTS